MPNKNEENQPGTGEGKAVADESAEKNVPRLAGHWPDFDEDTDQAIRLPRVKPEVTEADDADKKKADSAFDDQEIMIDEDEVLAESDSQPPGRKY
jgi:hypothetical protein